MGLKAKNRVWQRAVIGLLCSLMLWEAQAFANYRNAQAAYAKKNYAKAAALFFQTYGYPKSREQKYLAEWGLAQSLHRLGFYYSASKYYSIIVRRGTVKRNSFFTSAMEELGKIDESLSLGQSHVVQLFKARVDPSRIPGRARGFYFFYKGIEEFNKSKYEAASRYFKRVPSSSNYHLYALFHLGVISNLRGNHSRAISYLEHVRSGAGGRDGNAWVREQANMNIARVNYEVKRYRKALQYYAQIPRESDNWLQALFEASWTFFLMQKHNNTLGTIHTLHSPFFNNRFFPESYILQAITYLRLCRFDRVKKSLRDFKNRYKPVFDDVRKMLDRYERNPKGFFRKVYEYKVGSLKDYRKAWSILDALSRTDTYKEAGNTIRFADNELVRLSRYGPSWGSSGLLDELKTFLRSKKSAAVSDAGRRLFRQGARYYAYLKELSSQTQLINTEMVLDRVNELRRKLNVGAADKKGQFIGGLQPLAVGQDLEYWPFEGEYWEDELGGYVYNIGSQCGGKK